MRNFLISCSILSALSAVHAATIDGVSLSTDVAGLVTVTYSLDEDAIVTADVRTNGVSIGGCRQWSLAGDVHRAVTAGEGKKIVWNPKADIPETTLENVTVELKAWAKSDAPDYMVADLLKVSDCRIRYYTSVDFLPGGIVSNEQYRMYYVPFRKIPSKGVEWTMGTTSELGRSTDGRETAHKVTLDYNYYIAVFETTKAQVEAVGSTMNGDCTHAKTYRWRLTPAGRSPWNAWRGTMPPADPSETSILGRFSSRTGLKIDLPLESQWEFAARGGYGEGTWGDGSAIRAKAGTDANLTRLAIYKSNIAAMTETGTCEPNGYGLYDMHGNIFEYCRDWYQPDITALNGALCVHPDDSTLRADGIPGTNRVCRGGYFSYNPDQVRASYRASENPGYFKTEKGARLMTLADLGEEVEPSVAVSEIAIAWIDTHAVQPAAALSASPVALRTSHVLFSDAFPLDTLTPYGLMFILR